MNKLFQSTKKLDRSNRESARNGESKSKQQPRVTSPTFGNDRVIKEDGDGDGNIDNRLLLLRIQQAFLPALQLDHQNPYEHPQEQIDRTIPPVLREARLLVERYEVLVEKFKEQSKQSSNGHSYNKFDADLEKARAEIKAKEVDIFKLGRDHDRIYSDMRSDHRRTLEEQRQKWQDHVDDLKDTHRRDLNAARTDGNGWYARSGQLEKELKKVQYQNQILAEQNQRVEGETHGLREKQRNHDAIIQQLHDKYHLDEKQTISDHQVATQSLKDSYEAEIQRVGASGRRAGEAMREDYEGQIAVLKVNHEGQIDRLIKEQTSRIQRLQKDWDEKANRYEAEKMQLREDFEDRKAELGRLHDEAIGQLEAEKSQLREDAQTRETELRENFEARQAELDEMHDERMAELDTERKRFADEIKTIEDKLTKAHAQETDRLKRDIQSRNKAFISRDTFVPVTDGGLKSAFFDIIREVDTISRLKWAFNNSPWTDTFQSQITDNPKRLQKQILQDTIWGVFFECIFCSPFRVFGEEGLVLEAQWNEAFGKFRASKNEFYTWPEPNFGSEKWRYETLRSCQETLKTATSAYDHRTKLREAYNQSLDVIQEKIEAPIKMVSDLDQGTTMSIRGLIEKAAKMWILFGTQRCRIMIVMHDLKTETESKVKKSSQTSSVELIIRPELRRIGDSDGGSLEKEQTVAGCEGEAKKIMHSGL